MKVNETAYTDSTRIFLPLRLISTRQRQVIKEEREVVFKFQEQSEEERNFSPLMTALKKQFFANDSSTIWHDQMPCHSSGIYFSRFSPYVTIFWSHDVIPDYYVQYNVSLVHC